MALFSAAIDSASQERRAYEANQFGFWQHLKRHHNHSIGNTGQIQEGSQMRTFKRSKSQSVFTLPFVFPAPLWIVGATEPQMLRVPRVRGCFTFQSGEGRS